MCPRPWWCPVQTSSFNPVEVDHLSYFANGPEKLGNLLKVIQLVCKVRIQICLQVYDFWKGVAPSHATLPLGPVLCGRACWHSSLLKNISGRLWTCLQYKEWDKIYLYFFHWGFSPSTNVHFRWVPCSLSFLFFLNPLVLPSVCLRCLGFRFGPLRSMLSSALTRPWWIFPCIRMEHLIIYKPLCVY